MHIYTKEEEQFIIDNYNKTLSGKEISKILNVGLNSLRLKARNLGVAGKRPPVTQVDHFFFHNVNINSSYWAGFLAADGWLEEKNKAFCLTQADKNVLMKFKEASGHTGKIYERTREIKIKDQKPFISTEYYIRVRSKQMYSDITNIYGIRPNKSKYGNEIPKIDHINAIAFLVGYLDGDGTIGISNNKLYYSITIHENLIKWYQKELFNDISYYLRKDVSCKFLCRMNGRGKKAEKLLYYCYNNVVTKLDFYLERKWNIVKNY